MNIVSALIYDIFLENSHRKKKINWFFLVFIFSIKNMLKLFINNYFKKTIILKIPII